MTYREALEAYAGSAGEKFAALVRRYLEWGGRGTDADLTAYLEALVASGMQRSTADLHRRTIRAFYHYLASEYPELRIRVPKAKGWRFEPTDSARVAVSPEVILAMIESARTDLLPPRTAAYVALATCYGMRAGELAAVGAEDVDLAGEKIFIRTEKGGEQRWCWVPPQIRSLLDISWRPVPPAKAHQAFWMAWRYALDQPKPNGLGWHSIRRALVVALRGAGVADTDIGRFLRWKGGGDRDQAVRMVQWYGTPTARVTPQGVETLSGQEQGTREYDRAAWDRHPWLRYWGN